MLSTNQGRSTRKYVVSGVVALGVVLLAATSIGNAAGGGFMFINLLLIPGAIGGAIAMTMLLMRGRPASSNRLQTDAFENGPTDVINYSRIRVAGIGGLGLVAMAIVIAFALPRVGQTLEIGLAGGVVAALFVVLYRRKVGPLSGSDGPRGREFLVADGDDDEEPTPGLRSRRPGSPDRPLQSGASV